METDLGSGESLAGSGESLAESGDLLSPMETVLGFGESMAGSGESLAGEDNGGGGVVPGEQEYATWDVEAETWTWEVRPAPRPAAEAADLSATNLVLELMADMIVIG